MGKYLHVNIPESCSENWNDMLPNSQGKHCLSCQKTVVDFTGMTDTELISFFKKNTNNTCGRFTNDQLQRNIPVPKKKVHWMKYFFKIVLPAMFLSTKASAQEDTTKPAIEVVDTTRPVQQSDSAIEKPINIDDSLKLTFDTFNNYKFDFPTITVTGNTLIKCDWETIGFTVIEQKDSRTLPSLPIASIFSDILNKITNKKEPIPQPVPLPSMPTQTFITLFPSPVKASGILYVLLENGLLGKYNFFIGNNQGTVLQKGNFLVAENNTEATILLEQLPSDDYTLILVHEATGEKMAQQFVVV